MRNQQNKRNRNYQVKKRGIKDDYIDKQVWVIHQAMALKLLKHPELLPQIEATLDARKKAGRLSYSAYITWLSIIEMYDDKEAFLQGILEDSPRMKRFRRETPLVGILTEDERQAALEQDAIGVIPNINVLF
ncbi:hypothetical protein ACFSJY_01895 [Thalassotalea euphylliae]|uniref:hypothetical protein n=1 Tax=Thalassotalea euphylliae TaxID=1655234 RepID=UPI00362C3D67